MALGRLVAAFLSIGLLAALSDCGGNTNDEEQSSESDQHPTGKRAITDSTSSAGSTKDTVGRGGAGGASGTNSGRGAAGGASGTVSGTPGSAGSGSGNVSPGAGGAAAGSAGTAAGGSSSPDGGPPSPLGTDGGTGGANPGEPPFTLPVAVNPWKPSDACKAKAAELLGKMNKHQKVAQMIQGETLSTSPDDVKNSQLGAVFGGGNADPSSNNGASAWADLGSQYQSAGIGSGIPILYGIDAVHGHNNVRDATMFPHNIGLGCTRDADIVRRVFRATAEEVRATAINWTFAPTIAAARDERWGRTFETFSEDPLIVAWMGQAAVEGLQQGNLKSATSILACAKHFAGDGNTADGTDKGDVVMDDATFHRLAVDQYQPLINSGVASVMISYSQYGTSSSSLQRVTGSKALVTDLLKTEMGFAGIVVSDYNAIQKLPGDGPQQVASGVNAGLDMLMLAGSGTWQGTMDTLEKAVDGSDANAVPMSRIDDAVTRILQVKCEMGMFDSGYSVKTDPSQIGSAAHRAIAREAVSKSLVVLKNDSGVLPLSKSAKLLVAGTAADSMAKQCGGWTIDWQGLGSGRSADSDTTKGTTILAGIRAMAGESNVTFSQDGTAAAGGAAVGVVVVGEEPYAEQYGDTTDVTLKGRSSADDTALRNMLDKKIPIVLVVISGRPLILDAYLGNANLRGVVAAWLPGSEGAGVSDVLFGAVKPTGKLGHSWPKDGQIPINFDDPDYKSDPPAFPIGHGLTW